MILEYFNPAAFGLLILFTLIEPDMVDDLFRTLLGLSILCFTAGSILTYFSLTQVVRNRKRSQRASVGVKVLLGLSIGVLLFPVFETLDAFSDVVDETLWCVLAQGVIGLALSLLTARAIKLSAT